MSAPRRLSSSPSTPLLFFQLTTFIAPWLIVMWLTKSGDVTVVAKYSYLLALISPLCLLLASPSRNYMLSDTSMSVEARLGMRYWLIMLGFSFAGVLAWATGDVLLAFALYAMKVVEFLYDFRLVDGINSQSRRALIKTVVGKISIVVLAVAIALITDSIVLTLLTLALGFFVNATWGRARQFVFPANKVGLLITIIPLSLTSLVYSLYFNVPRYILGNQQADGLLAIFTVTSFLLMICLMMNNAFCQAKLSQWTQAFNNSEFAALKHSVLGTFVKVILLYAALQLFHLPLLAEWFWHLHNNLQQQHPEYWRFYHAVLFLAWGPLLFSFANYLLIVIQRHRFLLLLSAMNTGVTFAAGAYCFSFWGALGILWCVSLSGIVQITVCGILFAMTARSN